MVGPATGSFPVAGPTVTVWSRGSRESEHRVHRLLEVGDDVVGVFDAAAQAHQVNANACFDELFLGKLTVRGACRVQGAAASVGHVRGDGHHLQMVEERGHLFASARHAEGDDAASAVRHVLFGQRMVLVFLKAWEAHPADARVALSHCTTLSAFAQWRSIRTPSDSKCMPMIHELIGAGVEPKSRISCAVALVM